MRFKSEQLLPRGGVGQVRCQLAEPSAERRRPLRDQWQHHRDLCADPDGTAQLQLAAMRFDQHFGNRQSQTGAPALGVSLRERQAPHEVATSDEGSCLDAENDRSLH